MTRWQYWKGLMRVYLRETFVFIRKPKHRAKRQKLKTTLAQRKFMFQNRYYAFWLPAKRQKRKNRNGR